MSDKPVFEKCPNCKQDLHNALYRHLFGALAGSASNFEYECKACGAVLEVEAVPVPEFYVTLKRRPIQLAPDVGDSAASSGIVNASALSTSQAESAPTQRR
jgi:hypothetical protein